MGHSLQHADSCDKWPEQDASKMDIDHLVRSACKGNEQAFEYLFNRHRDKVLTICLSYSNGDLAQAKDLCQETFISAFQSLGQLRNGSLFPYWLREIAKNKCISYMRKQHTLVNAMKDYEVIIQGKDEGGWSPEDLELVGDLIESMKDSDSKQTIRLFYIEGKNSSEIADIQGISQTTVTTRLNRFRIKFRKRIIQDIINLSGSR